MKSIITILFLICFTSYAQNIPTITISFGENINLGEIEAETSFNISSESGSFQLNGNEINTYQFKKPGIYVLKTSDSSSHTEDEKNHICGKNHLPKEIKVIVSRIKMTFDSSKIAFSNPIKKNTETNGITMSIPVTIATYDNKPADLNFDQVNSAGIGTAIIAKLDDSYKKLPEGNHILKYALSGKVTENSYIMFDFVDANGKIQSASLLTRIENN